MTDDLIEALRHLDGVEYPGRADRLDLSCVVRAGRRRRTTRRIAGASTACLVVLALGLTAPSALHRYLDRQPTFPVGTPTTAASATEAASPTPTSTDTGSDFASFVPAQLEADQIPPATAVLAPGITAVTGVPAVAAVEVGEGDKISDRWYYAGQADATTLVLHVGAADDGQVFALYGRLDGATSTVASDATEARFDAYPYAAPWATTALPGRDGTFIAGVTPPGVAHAFYVSSGGFDTGDGTRRFALEVPTFAVPDVATVPDPDERMFALAFTNRPYDATNGMVYTGADGKIITDPACVADACPSTTSLPDLPAAYAEIQTILSGTRPTGTAIPMCAVFPAPASPLPGDIEGFWNATPADANGNVLTDPAQWPALLREHPRVALVDTATGSVISTWDRIACGPDPDFVPAPLGSGPGGPTAPASWPAGSVAVVDMDTGEMIYVLDSPGNH